VLDTGTELTDKEANMRVSFRMLYRRWRSLVVLASAIGAVALSSAPASAAMDAPRPAAAAACQGEWFSPNGARVHILPNVQSRVVRTMHRAELIRGLCGSVNGQRVVRPCGQATTSQWVRVYWRGGRIGYAVFGCVIAPD
jgi:hypothetical protein